MSGIDVSVVSKILGHKSVTTTYNFYIKVIPKNKVEAVKSLEKIFG